MWSTEFSNSETSLILRPSSNPRPIQRYFEMSLTEKSGWRTSTTYNYILRSKPNRAYIKPNYNIVRRLTRQIGFPNILRSCVIVFAFIAIACAHSKVITRSYSALILSTAADRSKNCFVRVEVHSIGSKGPYLQIYLWGWVNAGIRGQEICSIQKGGNKSIEYRPQI